MKPGFGAWRELRSLIAFWSPYLIFGLLFWTIVVALIVVTVR